MAKNKTVENNNSVVDFLSTIPDEKKRKDFATIIDMIKNHTGLECKMWGTGIVGFGAYHYKYESGREGDAPLAGMAARANAITFYLSSKFNKRDELLAKLGKHKTGKGCIYIQKIEDIDTKVLMQMVTHAIEYKRLEYP